MRPIDILGRVLYYIIIISSIPLGALMVYGGTGANWGFWMIVYIWCVYMMVRFTFRKDK
jgi:hypothetical protein